MMHRLGTLPVHKPQQGGVKAAIQHASARTGVDFGYLVKQADIESSLNPNAKAKTSSATGLYQFIEQTWLGMIKKYGAEHGYERFANAVVQRDDGRYAVANRGLKNQILNLRRDPKAASLMAAELASENHQILKSKVGSDVSGTDLYLAHFLGAQGAANFLNSMKKNPWAPAASLFPEAARANKGVFYKHAKPLSLQEVYNRFDTKFDGIADKPVTQVAYGDDTPEVILPRASDWSRPARHSARSAGMGSFNQPSVSIQEPLRPAPREGLLSAPVAVKAMMIAQKTDFLRFTHEDSSRYNA